MAVNGLPSVPLISSALVTPPSPQSPVEVAVNVTDLHSSYMGLLGLYHRRHQPQLSGLSIFISVMPSPSQSPVLAAIWLTLAKH
ncbi:MAG: hypothetical protein IPG00_20650 [Saprospiraceae bacterium]|nr:hypothetical protein [Saprospiraceae bacterium]